MVEPSREIKFPAPKLMKFQLGEYVCRVIWNKIHCRPKDENLQEFIINVLLWTLGEKWHKEQVEKSPTERHVIMRWLRTRYDFFTHLSLLGQAPGKRVVPPGEAREILSLAADV